MNRDGMQLVPAASLEEADIIVTPKLVRGRYIPQIAAEMYHDRHGEWPGRCKWAIGQKNPKARNMFAHNHWQVIMADQRREDPRTAVSLAREARRARSAYDRGIGTVLEGLFGRGR